MYTRRQGFMYTRRQGFMYTRRQGFIYTRRQGFIYTRRQGFMYTPPSVLDLSLLTKKAALFASCTTQHRSTLSGCSWTGTLALRKR